MHLLTQDGRIIIASVALQLPNKFPPIFPDHICHFIQSTVELHVCQMLLPVNVESGSQHSNLVVFECFCHCRKINAFGMEHILNSSCLICIIHAYPTRILEIYKFVGIVVLTFDF